MSLSIADLALRVDSRDADKASASLDKLSKAAGGAETSQEKLAAAGRAAANANGIVGASAQQATAQIAAEAQAMRTLDAVHLQATGSSKAFAAANRNAGRAAGLHGNELANLSFQLNDVITSLATGGKPLQVLAQQGGQVAQIFQVAAGRGIGFSVALASIGAALAPILIALAPIIVAVAAAAGAFALFDRALDKAGKSNATFGETFQATLNVIGKAIADGPIGKAAKVLGEAMGKILDFISRSFLSAFNAIAAHAGAAVLTIVKNFNNLPQALGAIFVGGANLALKAIEGLVNGTIGGINFVLKAAGQKTKFSPIDIPQIKQANNAVAADYVKLSKSIRASLEAAESGAFAAILKERERLHKANEKATKGAKEHAAGMSDETKAALELDRALKQLLQGLETTGEKTLREYNENTLLLRAGLDAGKISADEFREAMERLFPVVVAANDAQKAFRVELIKTPADLAEGIKGLEDMRTESERLEDTFYGIANAVNDVFSGIAGNDWVGAFSGLTRALSQVQAAFKVTGTSRERFAARAGAVGAVGSAVGGAIGGRGGAALSGAASGFAAGAAFGPIGAGIGAVVGGLAGFFGASKAKKAAKKQAAADAAAAEAERVLQVANQRRELEIQLMELQGNASGALAARRADELKATDETNRALLEQTYAAIDAAEALAKATGIANERRSLEVRLMEATGNAAGVLAAYRADELAALDESNRSVLQAVFAAEDLAAANAKLAEQQATATQKVTDSRSALTDAYERESSAIQATKEKFQGFADSLAAFRKELGGGAAAGGNAFQQYSRSRAEFGRLSALPAGSEERLTGLQGAGSAFLAASRAAAGTGQAFNRDLALVRQAVEASEKAAGQQVTAAQAQLDQLTSVVGQLVSLNTNTLSVADAITSLRDALLAAPVSNGNAELLAKIDTMTSEIAGMRAEQNGQLGSIVKTNAVTAQTIVRVSRDGESLLTVAA